MRILLFEPDLLENGAIRVSLDRAARWQEAGDQVRVVLANRRPDHAQQATPPADLRVEQAFRAGRLRYHALPGLRRLVAVARTADVVVSGREIDRGLLLAALVAALARRPFAVTVHSRFEAANRLYVPPRLQRATRLALHRADLAVAVSEGIRTDLTTLGFPAARTAAVTNGTDADRLRRAAAQPSPHPLPAGPYLVGLGRLSPQKGFDVLLRAHAHARRAGARPHQLVLIGDGPDRASLDKLAAQLGITDSVTMTGFLDNPVPLLSSASAFVLSSRWEGHPLALVEALLLGVPSIATDCVAGPREILDGGRLGRLVEVDDVEGLGAAITAVVRAADGPPQGLRAPLVDPASVSPAVAAATHRELLADLVAGARRAKA